jgi:hypothetical protein
VVSGRVVAGWGAGSLVVVGAVAAALINELHGGVWWWVAAAMVVGVWAVGTAWLSSRANRFGGVRQGAGSVVADRIQGSVRTQTSIEGWRGSGTEVTSSGAKDEGGEVMGEGAVRARLISGDVSTGTDLRASGSTPGTPPGESGPPVAR